jgi:hypothetical protein
MVVDALRGYAQLAGGLTDVTRQRAAQAARQLADQGGGLLVSVASSNGSAELARQVQGLAEDLLATSRTNRDLLVGLIRTEVERAIGRLGLVGADELSAMARVVERLQNQLDAAIAFGGKTVSDVGGRVVDADSEPETKAGRRSVRREPVTFAAPAAASHSAPAKKATKRPAKKAATKKTAKKATKKATNKATEGTVKKTAAKSQPRLDPSVEPTVEPTAESTAASGPGGIGGDQA